MPEDLFKERLVEVLTCQTEVSREILDELISKLNESAIRYNFETWEAYPINDKSYWIIYRNWP